MNRRGFLVASTVGLAGYAFGRPAQAAGGTRIVSGGGTARSTILFFLCGGASHIDTWDLKPDAPAEYRGPFRAIATSAPGVWLSEHLPRLAQQAHHIALLRSVDGTVNTNDHHGGYYYQLTGHQPDASFVTLGNDRRPQPDDWPFMGSVVAAKRPAHSFLPNAITLPHKPSRPPYTRPGQFAARLGLEFDPLYVEGSLEEPLRFHVPALELIGDTTADRLTDRRRLLAELDKVRYHFDAFQGVQRWQRHQQRAFDLLLASKTLEAFDLLREPTHVRDRYGQTVNGMSLLMARRLVEAGVPFVTVFWKENEKKLAKKCASAGGWDTHGNNFQCLKEDLLPEFDQALSALLEDLQQRGLLEQTLVLVTSEMGRKPKIGDPRSGGSAGAGRDHWTYCMTVVMAGGGIHGGQVYGSSDRYAEYPADKPLTPADLTKTVYYAMGIHDLTAYDPLGRPYQLLEEGRPIHELF